MFGKKKADNVEFLRRHVIAVHLVDAVNRYNSEHESGWHYILAGFRLKFTREQYGIYKNKMYKLLIKPAGWPQGSYISCFLLPQAGFYHLVDGEIYTPLMGHFGFKGTDYGIGTSHKPRGEVASIYSVFTMNS